MAGLRWSPCPAQGRAPLPHPHPLRHGEVSWPGVKGEEGQGLTFLFAERSCLLPTEFLSTLRTVLQGITFIPMGCWYPCSSALQHPYPIPYMQSSFITNPSTFCLSRSLKLFSCPYFKPCPNYSNNFPSCLLALGGSLPCNPSSFMLTDEYF